MNYKKFITEAHNIKNGKICGTCKEYKPPSEFYIEKSKKSGLSSRCKLCDKLYQKSRCPVVKAFCAKRSGAKTEGREFTIIPTDVPGIEGFQKKTSRGKTIWVITEYPKICPILKMDLDWGMNGQQPNSPSFDRIDNNKGYIPGNIMLMSKLANFMKNNATHEQLKQFSRYILFGNN